MRLCCPLSFTVSSSHRLSISTLAALTFAAVAAAQSGNEMVVKHGADGAPPQVMHFSLPDFAELKIPDFIKRDVPTFADKLVLSEDQTAAVQRLIEGYLESFKKLVTEHAPKGMEPVQFSFDDDGAPGSPAGNGKGKGKGGIIMLGGGGGDQPDFELPDLGQFIDDIPEMAEFQGDGTRTMSVGVTMRVGGPDGEDDAGAPARPAPQPESGVSIAIDSADGEIPEALRKKLEEAASKMAEEMKAKIEKQIAEGAQPGEAMPFGGAMNIEEMQKRNDELSAQAEAFRSAKAGLRQEFVNNVQSTVLATPQVERWPDLERTLRRQKTLPKGRLSGERTDLVKVLKDVELSEADRRAVAEPVQAYEITMDNALRQRNEFIPACETKIDKAMKENDADKALSILDRAAALRVAVRSVNEQFTDAIAQQLPAEKAQKFRDTVARVSYPSIYRTTFAQKTFAAAKKIDGLDEKTLAGINELEHAYSLELQSQNAQIRLALSKNEPLEPRRPIEQLKAINSAPAGGTAAASPDGMMMLGGGEQNPVREAFSKRRDVDDRYVKSVRELLSPEQAEQLPKPPVRRKPGEPMIFHRIVNDGAQ